MRENDGANHGDEENGTRQFKQRRVVRVDQTPECARVGHAAGERLRRSTRPPATATKASSNSRIAPAAKAAGSRARSDPPAGPCPGS